ncbi:MAG TPA: GMC family oxidoreductase N-terminal domain-containing protein [Steroidobacteraceae bacterium]|nr:GMC family oxidoreductase N-terminal domain-containing protein [Steroidobacteraceae bacterium]
MNSGSGRHDSFDYVIVGAGSAGCVLAERLSSDRRFSVLLVEAGPEDSHPLVHVPKGIGRLLSNPHYTWVFPTEPEPGSGSRPEYWVRGKLLGGSSSVNGMIYTRGQPQDYDHWAGLGLREWGWEVIAPYFKRMEDHAFGADELRGVGGPLGISQGSPPYPLGDALLRAARDMGIPTRDDLNRPDHEGLAYLCTTIKAGRRQSAAQAFLRRARGRPNLTVATRTVAQRVAFDGSRAVGVEAVRSTSSGKAAPVTFAARREVILSAGALQSPKLLQLSGIGPAARLRDAGVAVRIDSPGIGQNLREHRLLFIQHRLKRPGSVNAAFTGIPLLFNTLRYLAFRSGVLAGGSHDVGGFTRSRAGLDRPDIQLMMGPYSFDFSAPSMRFEKTAGLHVFGYVLRPDSQGSIGIRSPDPDALPKIQPNYLSAPSDRTASVALVRVLRRWMSQPAAADFVGEETSPGAAVQSDEQILDAFARQGQSGYHACGTCRMGTDAAAPLDAHLRVRGAQNLRVVDLSIFPTMISGNPNGPMMALAWRAADLIAADAR